MHQSTLVLTLAIVLFIDYRNDRHDAGQAGLENTFATVTLVKFLPILQHGALQIMLELSIRGVSYAKTLMLLWCHKIYQFGQTGCAIWQEIS